MTEDDLEKIDESSDISLDIDLEKLYLNMLNADAPHLYGLEQWDELLSEEKKKELVKTHRRAGTVVKGEKIGRNDPCPCGSGKKYKHCCGRN
jgi:preprotein translocase subunit SecA